MKISRDISVLIKNALLMGFSFRNGVSLFLLSLGSTFMEIFGVTMFLPIFQFIRLKGDIQALSSESNTWEYVITFFNFMGIEITL